MFTTILVSENISYGKTLLEKLPSFGFPVVEAFWYHFPDSGSWRLVIASPMLQKLGPLAAYTALRDILRKIKSRLELSDISFLSPNDPQYQDLRNAALGPGRAGVGAASGVGRDIVFSDAYLYAVPAGARTR